MNLQHFISFVRGFCVFLVFEAFFLHHLFRVCTFLVLYRHSDCSIFFLLQFFHMFVCFWFCVLSVLALPGCGGRLLFSLVQNKRKQEIPGRFGADFKTAEPSRDT